jgi:ubiquinone/menaquinone biosynthesis C-methylase UbiE
MRHLLFKIYWKLRALIAPELTHAQYLYEHALNTSVSSETKWLDLGCGHQVLPFWREDQERDLIAKCAMIVGMDYDLPSLQKHRSVAMRVRGHMNRLPFKDGHFNLVTANMVVEHLAEPGIQFREINRVLKPGGIFLFHTPNSSGYPTILNKMVPDTLRHKLVYILDGRNQDDVFETHYSANTESEIAELAEHTGFKVSKIRMTVSDAVFAMIPPIAIAELIYLRLLMTERFKRWRTNIITVLRKEEATTSALRW